MSQSGAHKPDNSTRRNSMPPARNGRQASVSFSQSSQQSALSSLSSINRRSSIDLSAHAVSYQAMDFYVMPGSKPLQALAVSTDPQQTYMHKGIETFSNEEIDLQELLKASFGKKEAKYWYDQLNKRSDRVWDIFVDPRKTAQEREEVRAGLDKYTTSRFEIQVSPAIGWDVVFTRWALIDGVDDFRLVKKAIPASNSMRPGLNGKRTSSFTGLSRRRSSVSTASPGTASRRQSVILEDSRQLRAIAHGRA